jgi:hypothetical protein
MNNKPVMSFKVKLSLLASAIAICASMLACDDGNTQKSISDTAIVSNPASEIWNDAIVFMCAPDMQSTSDACAK